MQKADTTDEKLVLDALKDKEAFVYIIERYEGKLRRYLSRITNVSTADLDDLLQDVFIKAYQNLNGFDASFPFSSWMYRIARNTAISDWRRRSSRPELLMLDQEDAVLHIADETDIEHTLNTQELSGILAKTIPKLREEYREVLILRFFEEKSYDEMSDILMKPPGTVATLLNRAKKELKKELQQQGHYHA